MKIMTKILIAVTIVTIGLSCPFVATAAQQLTEGEEAHLIFMRSEEKLARDVYLTLYDAFGLPVFYNIATQAEQTHTDTMQVMLGKFGIEDVEDVDEGTVGVFLNPYFSEYFTDKFTYLTGASTALDALYVGAFIEELDMLDINYCNQVVYDVFGFPPPPPTYCGLTATDVRPLVNTLGNLLSGSKNHLCAFISQIVRRIPPDECYEAQVLPQSEVNGYVGDVCPELLNYVCSP